MESQEDSLQSLSWKRFAAHTPKTTLKYTVHLEKSLET